MKGTITLVDIAKSANVNPSSARTKVRRLYADPATRKDLPKPKGRWIFDKADRSAVRKMLIN